MSLPDVESLIRKAIANGEVKRLLLGLGSYAYLPPRTPARGRTDLAEVLRILYSRFLPDMSEQINAALVDALESLVKEYEGLEPVARCILKEALNRSERREVLNLPIESLAEKLRLSIHRYSARLERDKTGWGADWPDGMIGEFRRLSTIVGRRGGPRFCDL